MSSLLSPAGLRAPRRAIAAVERARLSLVPTVRTRAPRAPFAVLVLAVLAAGVVGLLMFNTHMQQASFYATELQQQADDLTAQRQKLDMELDGLRDPQHLAEAGKELGLVAPPVPAFISLADGRVLGTPTAATPEDGVPIKPLPAKLPAMFDLEPIIVKVRLPAKPPVGTPTGTQTATGNGPASAAEHAAAGRTDATPDQSQGAHR